MRRRAAAAACLLLAASCSSLPPARERSLILVTLDTTRADRLGAYGGRAVPTPTLDRIARDGVLFEQAVSQVPLTLPAHSTILTARYPASHGVRHNGIFRLRDGEETLAEHLRAAGFRTAGFVGAYVLNRGFGTEQGFDTYDDVNVDRFAGGRDQVFEAQRTADEVNAAVFRWLDAKPAGRFFLWVHYYDPHEPYSPPEKPGRALSGSGYDREISYVDACLGDLLRELDRRGLLDRSILAVIGDHGESLGEHGEKTHGIFLYDGAVHVPLLLRAPGVLPAGRRVAGPVEQVDLAPTLLDYLGVGPLTRAQGKSLRPRIDGRDDGLGATAHAETLMPRLEFGWAELRMVRDSRFKYIEAPRPELYDLRDDAAEARNLAPNDADRAGEMAAALQTWRQATEDTSAGKEAARTLSAEEEARLRSLGYLGGDFFKGAGSGSRLDPKDGIAEVRRLDAARDLLRRGDAASALAAVEEILRANPKNHQGRVTAVMALLALKRLDRAEEEALAALAAAETDPEAGAESRTRARGLLASVYRLAGKDDLAEAQYQKILAVDPGDENAAVDYAGLLLESGRVDEAAARIGAVLAQDPRNGLALAARFRVELRRGDRAAATEAAEALSRAGAGDVPTLVQAGRILAATGKPGEAAACFKAALEQTEPLDPRIATLLGEAELGAGRLDDAVRTLTGAAALPGAGSRPAYLLGVAALRRGDAAAARRAFDEALRRDPGDAAAQEARARLEASKP